MSRKYLFSKRKSPKHCFGLPVKEDHSFFCRVIHFKISVAIKLTLVPTIASTAVLKRSSDKMFGMILSNAPE